MHGDKHTIPFAATLWEFSIQFSNSYLKWLQSRRESTFTYPHQISRKLFTTCVFCRRLYSILSSISTIDCSEASKMNANHISSIFSLHSRCLFQILSFHGGFENKADISLIPFIVFYCLYLSLVNGIKQLECYFVR